jgi:SulP family sulfate permease
MEFINGLHFNNVRGDIYGGITAGVVALPLALAFGVSSGAGPVAGLYGAIFVGLFAALFGGTPAQISGPTGPMTVVMAAIFTQYTAMFPGDPAQGAAIAFTVVILGGACQILFGALRLGQYISMVPHPVVSGFMSGIGVIIILLQLVPLFGWPAQGGPMESVRALPEVLTHPVTAAMVLGLIALVIVYFLPNRINRIIPSPLVALIVGTVTYLLVFPDSDAIILGAIPTGLPDPQLPTIPLALLPDMLKSAVTLAVLGSIDSLLTSLVADSITRTYHKPDRELVGQGIGNMVAGLFGGLPGAGATMRTVVNVKAGGKTPISGVLHAILLLAVALGAGGFARYIPHAVLAGILIKVGTDIIDWDYLKRLRSAPLAGVIMMFSVMVITVFIDLITAVAVGVVMASLVFMKRMTDIQLDGIEAINSPVSEESPLTDTERAIMEASNCRILLYRLSGPMSFSSAKGMARRLASFDNYDALILDLTDVPVVDFTTSRALEDIIHDAQDTGRQAYIVGPQPRVSAMLTKQGVIQQLAKDHVCELRLEAFQSAGKMLGVDVETVSKQSAQQL